jgi:M6 family metalloprotease-like protein
MARCLIAAVTLLLALGAGERIGATPDAASACRAPLLARGTSEGRNDETMMAPWVGRLSIAMLFVEFADARGRTDPQVIYDSYVPRVIDWYRTASYGRLALEVTPLRRWLSLPHPASYYRGEGNLTADAIAAADPVFDFAVTDALYIVLAGDAGITDGMVQLSPYTADGASIRAAAWLPTDGPAEGTVPFVTHETGHILGLPDLYVGGRPESFHHWDLMANPVGGLFAWHRWKLDWIEPSQLVCLAGRGTREAVVTPVERPGGVKAIVYRAKSAAYVAEVRQRIAEDAQRCRTGVLVYAVKLEATFDKPAIRLLPGRGDDSSRAGACGFRWNATYGVGRGEVSRLKVGSVRFTVMTALPNGSYRIRVSNRP